MKQFWQLLLAQFREFLREPGIIFWGLVFPIAMTWGLGIAFTSKDEPVRKVVWIKDNGETKKMKDFICDTTVKKIFNPSEHEYIKTIGNSQSGYTIYHFIRTDWNEAELMIKRGKASLIISENTDSLTFYFDPKNSEAQLAWLQLSLAMKKQDQLDHNVSIKPLEKSGMRYIDFLVPGLIAMNIMMSVMWGISYSLIEMRTKKLLRRMVATPMNKNLFLLSHFTGRILLNGAEISALLFFAWLYFDLTIQGSIIAFIVVIIAGNMTFSGLAILLSSRTANTHIGNGMINAVVMPMMLCSGIFFSYHNFPDWFIPFIQNLPLTILADCLRSIFTEGAGLANLSTEIAVLMGMGLVFFFTGLKIYKWY